MSSETRLSGPMFLQDSYSIYTSEASTHSSVDWVVPHREDVALVTSLADSLLASISEITVLVASLEAEQETFIEIGCYFYRVSMAITELKTTEKTPPNAVDILRSLSGSIGSATDLVRGIQKKNGPAPSPDLIRVVVSKLEEVIRSVGEQLISIPSSMYQDEEYAEVAIHSLSREMLNTRFEVQSLPEEKTIREAEPIETDLYSVDVQVSIEDSYFIDPPSSLYQKSKSSINGSSSRSQLKSESNVGRSLTMLPQLAQYMEPQYATFHCPLTKKVMDDPVTIETGATYERRAITKWFEKYDDSSEIFCPSGTKLISKGFNPNIALRSTIVEWKERNETARIKVARAALSLGSSESMVFEAVKDVHEICERNLRYKSQVFSAGLLPLLSRNLEYHNQDVRCAVLELLRLLAEDDNNEIKEMVAEDLEFALVISMLSSSNHMAVRHASLLLLVELSKSKTLCERIGSVPGAILMLITIKLRPSIDTFASEKADEALKNLERSPNNVKRMAENGLFEPLLSCLSHGSEETKTEMATCIGENALSSDGMSQVAESASQTLIAMVRTGNSIARRAAFQALSQISRHPRNASYLASAGIVPAMSQEIFSRNIHDELFDYKTEAASILANVFESNLDNLSLDLVLDPAILFDMIKSSSASTDELNTSLIRILICLDVKETDQASLSVLVDLISSRNEPLAIPATKLLIALSSDIGHIVSETLCEARGQPESLVRNIITLTELNRISEKQVVSAELLTKLPHRNLNLNLALLFKNAVPTVIETIRMVRRTYSSSGGYYYRYLEGLVGVLVRFTTTINDPAILSAARAHNFTSILTEILAGQPSSDEIRRLSALGLGNLSSESINLSKPSQPNQNPNPIVTIKSKKKPILARVFSRTTSKNSNNNNKAKELLAPRLHCRVHGGLCSSADTFCLVEAGAVEKLLECLDGGESSDGVTDAVLTALCTLMDSVDGVRVLSEFDGVRRVLGTVRDRKRGCCSDGVKRKWLWMTERFLDAGDISVEISRDRSLGSSLVDAFHYGDEGTSEMAGNILRRLNKIPSTSNYSN